MFLLIKQEYFVKENKYLSNYKKYRYQLAVWPSDNVFNFRLGASRFDPSRRWIFIQIF